MRLPNADRAVVDSRKISAYLLSVAHPVGRHKWRFFQSLGFTPDDLERLRDILLAIATRDDVVESVRTRFGVRYIVDGKFTAPNGSMTALRTVWIIERGAESPRFVTAFPR